MTRGYAIYALRKAFEMKRLMGKDFIMRGGYASALAILTMAEWSRTITLDEYKKILSLL